MRSGIIERVHTTECQAVGKVHYLPHHGVVQRDALTTKLRIVFDASSRATKESASLNDCQYSGPALTPTVFKILLRFRDRKIALVWDIEKAFLNISVQEHDRDVLRFLWIDSFEKDDPKFLILSRCVWCQFKSIPVKCYPATPHQSVQFGCRICKEPAEFILCRSPSVWREKS